MSTARSSRPEGLPIGVDHVAAMQDVMLGSLGGTITLTQSEDKSWKLGDITVTDGYVHTAANGNMYALMMDADGMWSGTYQEVMVTVALGTQGLGHADARRGHVLVAGLGVRHDRLHGQFGQRQ